MDSDEETMYFDCDIGSESSEDDDSESTMVDVLFDAYDVYPVEEPNHHENRQELDDYPYEVLTTEQVLQHMNECVKQVSVVTEMPSTIVRMLLNHFRWDEQKLMERFYDGDQEKFFSEAQVANPFRLGAKPVIKGSSIPIVDECEICSSTFVSEMMTGLECGHRLWISCAAHNCQTLVDDDTVVKLIPDAEMRQKYQHLITNSFVECHRLFRWCPSPGCCSVIRVQHVESRPVTCRCNHTFCFACGNNWHEPVSCNLLNDDSETYKWIAANTKECPICKVTIEKNGGCKHIVHTVCSNSQCGTQFCYVCLEP